MSQQNQIRQEMVYFNLKIQKDAIREVRHSSRVSRQVWKSGSRQITFDMHIGSKERTKIGARPSNFKGHVPVRDFLQLG